MMVRRVGVDFVFVGVMVPSQDFQEAFQKHVKSQKMWMTYKGCIFFLVIVVVVFVSLLSSHTVEQMFPFITNKIKTKLFLVLGIRKTDVKV